MGVHHYEHASKQQSIKWKHTSSPRTKKFKSVPSADKVMLTFFCDFNRPILEHYQGHGQAINSARYCAVLEE